ncbi:MAG: squalene synthase HpnC [Phycisphaerae bacterium]|nr:squalene synthase HpnC [Phycisphaerae bacterium]
MATPALDPSLSIMELLARHGPASMPEEVSLDDAMAYVRGLASSHYENFSVLSALAPADLRDDFAAVYAFCRWADDLGDETGSDDLARARSGQLLGWWRDELRSCFEGHAEHPVYVALGPTVRKHGLPIRPFEDLIDAFQQDQSVRTYRTWDELLGYCARSANPVGRLVLGLAGYGGGDADRLAMSDATCTALQLTNFWQDVRRDLLERDRVYLPSEETGIGAAELRVLSERADDPAARVKYIRALRPLVERTRDLFERGSALPRRLDGRIAPVVWLFGAGGRAVLDAVERSGCVTLWERPRLSYGRKAWLVARAWAMARLGMFGDAAPDGRGAS